MLVFSNSGFSRRHFCRLLSTAPFAAVGLPALAAPVDEAALSADFLVMEGTLLLRRGRLFEKAASDFALAAQKEPQNPLPLLGVACACVSRAASLAYAAGFAQKLAEARASYPDSLKEWEQSRDEAKAESPQTFNAVYFEAIKPTLPDGRDFVTKDDWRLYQLTKSQWEARLTALATQAQDAWEISVRLSKTPEEKAQAFFVQGWGMRVLHEYLATEEPEATTQKTPPTLLAQKTPTQADILRAFDKAIAAMPDNPLYWQAKGDALSAGEDNETANKAYRKALSLEPQNAAALWYLLYESAVKVGYETPRKNRDVAQEYLHNAQAHDRGQCVAFIRGSWNLVSLRPVQPYRSERKPRCVPRRKRSAPCRCPQRRCPQRRCPQKRTPRD